MAKKKRKKATRSSSKKKSSRRTSPKRKKGARRAAKKAAAKKRRAAKKARKPAKKRARKASAKRQKSHAKKKRGGKAKAPKKRRGRPPVGAHKPLRKGCKKCVRGHTAHAHDAHGHGSHRRVHGGAPERNPGPMLGVLTCCNPERHLPGCRCVAPQPLAPRKLPKRAFTNPGGKKRGGKKRARGSALERFLATKPVGFKCRWKNLPDAVKRDKLAQRAARMKLARLRAQGYRLELDDVLLIVRPRPKGASAAMVHVGDQIAEEYRDEGGRHYRHAAGDHGRGRKKSKPPAIAIDVVSRQQHLVGGHGVRRGFSSRGITG